MSELFFVHSDGTVKPIANIHRISNGEFPPDNRYVLIFCGSRPWRDCDDEYGKYWKVAKFVRGISRAERESLLKKGDFQSLVRANSFMPEDEGGNNLVPYYFTEFGPGCFFGQEIDIWANLPQIEGVHNA